MNDTTTTRICTNCLDEIEFDDDDLDTDSIESIRRELAASVTMTSGSTGLHARDGAERARSASRIAFLASRMAWLEACAMQAAQPLSTWTDRA